mmetsp:Transcript_2770/g.9755  ORF Transcript_2770/g.9755 Transcript_2770/m.9755 type:complete len:304 (+) Transcript_2770:164-1075(+)
MMKSPYALAAPSASSDVGSAVTSSRKRFVTDTSDSSTGARSRYSAPQGAAIGTASSDSRATSTRYINDARSRPPERSRKMAAMDGCLLSTLSGKSASSGGNTPMRPCRMCACASSVLPMRASSDAWSWSLSASTSTPDGVDRARPPTVWLMPRRQPMLKILLWPASPVTRLRPRESASTPATQGPSGGTHVRASSPSTPDTSSPSPSYTAGGGLQNCERGCRLHTAPSTPLSQVHLPSSSHDAPALQLHGSHSPSTSRWLASHSSHSSPAHPPRHTQLPSPSRPSSQLAVPSAKHSHCRQRSE